MYDRTAVGLPQPIFTGSDEPTAAEGNNNTPPAEVVPMPSSVSQPTRPAERVIAVDPASSKAATTKPSTRTQATTTAAPAKSARPSTKEKDGKAAKVDGSNKNIQKTNKGLHYRIQIAVNSDRLSSEDKQFRGLDHLYIFKEGGRFKYVTGIYATKAEAQAALKEVRKSFSDAFIVKFNGNTHVP